MLLKTRGIVLRTQKYSESSLICRIFTEERGLKSYIISGVRKQNARVGAGVLQLMSILDLVVYDREDKDLLRIKELKSHYVFQNIPYELSKGSLGLFIIEIVQKTIREQEENKDLFLYLFKQLKFIDQSNNPINNAHLHFLLEYSSFLGFAPSGLVNGPDKFFNLELGSFGPLKQDKFSMSEEDSLIVSNLLHLSLEETHTLSVDSAQRNRLLKMLIKFYGLHIENFPEINSHRVLRDVMR